MLILTGKSCSGKDSVLKELLRICGMEHVKSYTTRPKREHETDGIEYHFVSYDEFLAMQNEGKFGAQRAYNVTQGRTWYYGMLLDDIKKHSENGVAILDPNGVKELLDRGDLDLTVFYISASPEVIRGRLIQRGDDPEEAERRTQADNKDFENIEQIYNYAIENNGRKSPTILAEEIWLIYKTEKRLLEDLHDRESNH